MIVYVTGDPPPDVVQVDVTTGMVIDTVIEVLDGLTDLVINDIEAIAGEERGLQTIKARIHLITNILDARKLRRPVLVGQI
jgi:hypothetical protein